MRRNAALEMLMRVTPLAALTICSRMVRDRKRCFANSGFNSSYEWGRNPKQKLLRYVGCGGGDVTAEAIPTSSRDSDEAVKSTSPYAIGVWDSVDRTLTMVDGLTSAARFANTFI